MLQPIWDQIVSIFRVHFGVEISGVAPDATLRGTLRLDSLDVADLAAIIEREFRVEPAIDPDRELRSLIDLARIVADRGRWAA